MRQKVSHKRKADAAREYIQDRSEDGPHEYVIGGAQAKEERFHGSFFGEEKGCKLRYGDLRDCCKKIKHGAVRIQMQFEIVHQSHQQAGEKANAKSFSSGIALWYKKTSEYQKEDMAQYIGYTFHVDHFVHLPTFSETKRRYSRLTVDAFALLTGSCFPEFIITLSVVNCFT